MCRSDLSLVDIRSVRTAYRLNYHVLGQRIHEIGSMKFLPAGCALHARPAGPKIALHFPWLLVYIYIRERGSVLYLGMATEILNLPQLCTVDCSCIRNFRVSVNPYGP